MRIAIVISLGLWMLILSACSVKFEVGYHGETAIEDKTFTDKKK